MIHGGYYGTNIEIFVLKHWTLRAGPSDVQTLSVFMPFTNTSPVYDGQLDLFTVIGIPSRGLASKINS